MENMEVNEIMIPEEAIEEVLDTIPENGGSGFKTVAKVTAIGAASVVAWEFAIKPLGRKVTGLLKKAKAKKLKKSHTDEVEDELFDEDITDIPEIDD